MKFSAQILSEDEQEAIHRRSIQILEQVGIRFHARTALQILEKHGGRVDWDQLIARIPAELVEQALQTTPKSFLLKARNPAYDFPLPSPAARYCIDGTAAFCQDFHTGERRYGTLQDIQDSLRVFQQLDMGVMAWAPTCASDTPSHSRALHEFFAMMKYSSKHGEHELHTVEQVPYLVEGLEAVLGSEDGIRSNPIYSLIYCPVAPLTHDGPMLEAYLELGQAGLPVMIMPMPVTGTTGPASLFSNICVANAEALSTITVFQLAHPGRALIYSSAIGSIDFRSGAYMGGSAEMSIQSAALAVMGRYYHLPSTCAGCTSDAHQPGPEAVLDKLITTLPAVLTGPDIIIGIGEMESDQLLVLEQLLVDNEIAHLCERIRDGVDASEARDYFSDIQQVGPGGHFLKARSTRQAARSREFYLPGLMDRHTYEAWLSLGKPSMYQKARQKVEEILAQPLADPLPEAVTGKLEAILEKADRELGD